MKHERLTDEELKAFADDLGWIVCQENEYIHIDILSWPHYVITHNGVGGSPRAYISYWVKRRRNE